MSHKMTREMLAEINEIFSAKFDQIFSASTQELNTIFRAYAAGLIASFFATKCAGLTHTADADHIALFREEMLRFADDLTKEANRIRQRVAEAN